MLAISRFTFECPRIFEAKIFNYFYSTVEQNQSRRADRYLGLDLALHEPDIASVNPAPISQDDPVGSNGHR